MIENLDQAEERIQKLLSPNEADWKKAARIAIEVQDKKLYEQQFNSFTAWVDRIAQKCDRQSSLIWRHIKASRYYLQLRGSENLEILTEIKAAPEALERLEKVKRNAPQPVFEKLKEKVLAGEATVRECRQIEQEYRPEGEQLRRGRPSKGQEGCYKHLGNWETVDVKAVNVETKNTDNASAEPLSRRQIATTIARSLSINLVNWTCECAGMNYPPRNFKEHTEVRVNVGGIRRRIDFLAVVRWSVKRPKEIFAIEIKSCLSDFEADNKWIDYLDFCHYFCFAIPNDNSELLETIATTNSTAGILGVDFNSEIGDDLSYPVYVIRSPQKLEGKLVARVYETLYERALGWSGSDRLGDEDEVQ